MPVLPSSKKALRKARKRTKANKAKLQSLKEVIKKFKKQKDPNLLEEIYSMVDKMVKTHIFHKNKGARIKSRLAKLVQDKEKKESKPSSRSLTGKKK